MLLYSWNENATENPQRNSDNYVYITLICEQAHGHPCQAYNITIKGGKRFVKAATQDTFGFKKLPTKS